MKKYVILLCFIFFGMNLNAQEKNETKKSVVENTNSGIGVVDMKKILAQSKAYQSLVDQFEDVRRKHRNTFTKQEDIIRDEESELLKQKNILSKEAYAEKVKVLGKKLMNLRVNNQQMHKNLKLHLKDQQVKFKVHWLTFCQ